GDMTAREFGLKYPVKNTTFILSIYFIFNSALTSLLNVSEMTRLGLAHPSLQDRKIAANIDVNRFAF
ncbi:hypothetical protein L9F63_009899, partial [Diploptera punctata]